MSLSTSAKRSTPLYLARTFSSVRNSVQRIVLSFTPPHLRQSTRIRGRTNRVEDGTGWSLQRHDEPGIHAREPIAYGRSYRSTSERGKGSVTSDERAPQAKRYKARHGFGGTVTS